MGLHRIFSEKCRNMYVVFFFLVDPLHCYCCCRRRNDLLCLLLFTLQECSNQHILWESDFLLVFFLPLPFHFCSVLFGSLWLRALFSLNRIRVQHMAQRIQPVPPKRGNVRNCAKCENSDEKRKGKHATTLFEVRANRDAETVKSVSLLEGPFQCAFFFFFLILGFSLVFVLLVGNEDDNDNKEEKDGPPNHKYYQKEEQEGEVVVFKEYGIFAVMFHALLYTILLYSVMLFCS